MAGGGREAAAALGALADVPWARRRRPFVTQRRHRLARSHPQHYSCENVNEPRSLVHTYSFSSAFVPPIFRSTAPQYPPTQVCRPLKRILAPVCQLNQPPSPDHVNTPSSEMSAARS